MQKNFLTTFLAVATLVLALSGWWWLGREKSNPVEQLRVLRLRGAESPEAAAAQIRQILADYPLDREVQQAALKTVLQIASDEQLAEFLGEHESWRSKLALEADQVRRLLDVGYYETALDCLVLQVKQNPDDTSAQQALADLQLRLGQTVPANSTLRRLLRANSISLEQLIFLCTRREVLEDEQGLTIALQAEPTASIYAALGAWELSRNRFAAGHSNFERALDLDSQCGFAWAGLGLSLFRQGLQAELQQWRRSVRQQDIHHPNVSFLLGWLAEQQGNAEEAVRYLVETVSVDPLHRSACQTLGVLLSRRPQFESEGRIFTQRAATIDQLELLMHEMLLGEKRPADFLTAAELCAQLGEADLAVVWLAGMSIFADTPAVDAPSRAELAGIAEQSRSRWLTALDVAASAKMAIDSVPLARSSEAGTQTDLSFEDCSEAVGLSLPYAPGVSDGGGGLKIFEGFGGGVAVIDYDNDDHPDVFLTQACSWPPPESLPPAQQDLLYRQRHGQFEQSNQLAIPDEADFGQGVAVGDWNRDGFEDLYVANIGDNRLLLNNGDGTFSESQIDLGPQAWTTSCLLADIDGDGFDDLYDAQYLSGSEPFERVCGGEVGGVFRERSCLPSLFEPSPDRLARNNGDGSSTDLSEASGLQTGRGRGLGVLAADLDGLPGLEIFVANDLSANHCWKVAADHSGIHLTDQAEVIGLARNGEGQLEACMGIAAADFSGNSQVDLVVTNFLNETNTFYRSVGGGFFRDSTEASQLGVHSRSQLGFGVQALDADLDGDFDLVVANGHVDDYTHLGAPFRMKVDLFQNTNDGLFIRCPPQAAGEYGAQRTLGRSVARLDWNGDGRDDLLITHLDRRPALLENRSKAVDGWISLRLTGTESNRSAVGAVVSVVSGDTRIVLQQQAGDGYYCSNERRLSVGGLAEDVVDKVEVRWPSGHIDEYLQVPTKQRLSLVEGRQSPYWLSP
ncbi:MAG: FG-GAP-like repeat-containing protein [Planctomycetaceae bacterium]|nr:FG-GAP-like repeat-containing protein [Planctomycetaceae bacterium]